MIYVGNKEPTKNVVDKNNYDNNCNNKATVSDYAGARARKLARVDTCAFTMEINCPDSTNLTFADCNLHFIE